MYQITLRGHLEAQQQIELLKLPPVKRRRLLGQVGRKVRTSARKNLRNERHIAGASWAPRKNKGPRMLRNMGKHLVSKSSAEEAVVTFDTGTIAMTAFAHQEGIDELMTPSKMNKRYGQPDYNAPATKRQARALRQEGFKMRRKGDRPYKPTLNKIMATMKQGQAGLILRLMRDEQPKKSWVIPLPARSFLGANEDDVTEIVQTIFNQTINAKT